MSKYQNEMLCYASSWMRTLFFGLNDVDQIAAKQTNRYRGKERERKKKKKELNVDGLFWFFVFIFIFYRTLEDTSTEKEEKKNEFSFSQMNNRHNCCKTKLCITLAIGVTKKTAVFSLIFLHNVAEQNKTKQADDYWIKSDFDKQQKMCVLTMDAVCAFEL